MSRITYFDFSLMNDEEINTLLQNNSLKLTVAVAKNIQSLLQRPPTLAECVLWSIQGSEHCSYKSTKKYLKLLPSNAPQVLVGPGEDAAVVSVAQDYLGHRYGIVISHESHNHPSQVVPFEGAATGVGGNVRDVSCMGAEVIALADCLRFGDYSHPKTQWIQDGVVAGIASYGNALGIPNIAGDVYYDACYQHNCLVSIVTLGLVREDALVRSFVSQDAVGHVLILIGKATDASGFGGAGFASDLLDEAKTMSNKAAVQEPNAFLGKLLLDANLSLCNKLKALNAINDVACKDLGAGGIACASVEIAGRSSLGATIKLELVHTAIDTLPPEVILCAETQERYLWAVPKNLSSLVLAHYNEEWQLPTVSKGAQASIIGEITQGPYYIVMQQTDVLVHAKASDITHGLKVEWPHTPRDSKPLNTNELSLESRIHQALKDSANSSEQLIYASYDKQVQGRTLLERGKACAGVLTPFNSSEYPEEIKTTGVALAVAHHPQRSKRSAYEAGYQAVISSMCKVIAVGAKPLAITNCLCCASPETPETMDDIIQAIKGMRDACVAVPTYDSPMHPTPVVGGNVSLYNESNNQAIPISPIVSCIGVLEDSALLMTHTFKQTGSELIVVSDTPSALFAVIELIRKGLLLSVAAFDYEGLADALILMSTASHIGFSLRQEYGQTDYLFSAQGGLVLECSPVYTNKIQTYLKKKSSPYELIGKTIKQQEWQWNSELTVPMENLYD